MQAEIRIGNLCRSSIFCDRSSEKASMPPDPEPSAASRREPQPHVLHNFSFPVLKKWGNQRVLRCLNVNGKGEIIGRRSTSARRSGAVGRRIRDPDEKADGAEDERGLDEVREKLLVHLREAADRLNLVVPPKGVEPVVVPTGPKQKPRADPEPVPAPEPSSSAADAAEFWNLRRRRAPIRMERRVSLSPPADQSNHARSVRLRSEVAERSQRPRFSISLSRDEIEEDIYAVTGSIPRRRPRKRARTLQKQLDSLFPGSWLSEITADSYKVPD